MPMTKPTSEQVTFLAAGTGAQQRTALDKMRETVSVKDFGAVGDGVANDTAAIVAAIAAVGAQGSVLLPSGNYRTTSTIELPNLVNLIGHGAQITAAHNGIVIQAIGIPQGSASRNSNLISSIRFSNASGFTPLVYIDIGRETPRGLGLSVTIEKCLFIQCAATFGVRNLIGYGTTLKQCVFNSFTGTCVKTRSQGNSGTLPAYYWTFSLNMYACDIVNITGKGVDVDAGDVMLYGGVIEGCSAGGIDFLTGSQVGRQSVGVIGVHFESNTSFHIRCSNPAASQGMLTVQTCRFYQGSSASSALILNTCHATLIDCHSSPGGTITGYIVRMINCYGMFGAGSTATRLTTDNWVQPIGQPSGGPTVVATLGKQVNVNASNGGGAALILCSHQNSTGNATNAELFLIRYGNNGNNYSAESIKRSAGTDTSTYSFSVDVDGFLTVSSGDGNARYMVVANMCGFDLQF